MPGPIIISFARVRQLGLGGSFQFLIEGGNFNASTRFTITDVANPGVVWSPATQPGQVLDNGTRAQIGTTPSMPGGGPLPASGDLRLSAFAAGVIAPQLSVITKAFVYQGMFELSHAGVH